MMRAKPRLKFSVGISALLLLRELSMDFGFSMDIESTLSNTQLTLLSLVQAPFSTPAELTRLDTLGQYRKSKAMAEALTDGLVDRVKHGGMFASPRAHSYRWFLTGEGVNELADALGHHPNDLLREYPVSAAWQSSILGRVDTAQVVYRLRDLAVQASGERCHWHWHREDWRDGTLEVGESCYLHVRRLGDAMTRRATASRLGEMMEDWKLGRMGAVLFIVTSYTMMRFVERWLRDNAGGVYAWTVREKDMFSRDALRNIWHVPTSTGIRQHSMKRMLDPVPARIDERTSSFVKMPSYERVTLPPRMGRLARQQSLSSDFSALSPPARRVFDIVADWALISQTEALGISGMSKRNWQKIARQLAGEGLIRGFELKGATHSQRRARYGLTDKGCKIIARRDRVLERQLSSLWSVMGGGGTASWQLSLVSLSGTGIQQLAKELKHTDGVHQAVSLLAQGCRSGEGVELVEVLPAHRSERWFKMKRGGQSRAVKPDASGAIRTDQGLIPFMLEYEERAITPSAMKSVIRKYVNYFDSPASVEDWGGFPVALITFGDVAAASRFTQYTAKNMPLPRLFGGTALPVYVTSIPAMESYGALGDIWFQPHALDQGAIPLSEVGDVG